ncbi:MAG: ATP-binding protein [Verrucomicrobia bacterium]|nr:ATP-binding protein [Verrucomicrobiota bacterium]
MVLRKKLPIGIQTIEKIFEENFVYIDKTDLIHNLITQGQYYFLLRPRRFGKSLLVSTLKAIFSGKKELFQDCKIYSMPFAWHPHPVIHLDFTQIVTNSGQELHDSLLRAIKEIAKNYNKFIECPSLKEGLRNLVMALASEGKVVVLVDEYDKPIVDRLANVEVADANREILKSVFETLKGLDTYLQFVFVTGVSKFAQVSLFSGFNNLKDITLRPEYSVLLGYTEKEIVECFPDYLQEVSREGYSIEQMREWYNGYRFSKEKVSVYNPYSTLNFLDSKSLSGFWFQTGTPSFLIEIIRKTPQELIPLSGCYATERELLDSYNPKAMSLKALMWQTGYLTLQNFHSDRNFFNLDFPNREVREAFFDSLVQYFAQLDSGRTAFAARECMQYLKSGQIDLFFQLINMFFAGIPYNLFQETNEAFYHAIFLTLLEAMGIQVHAEQKTSLGRIDLVVELDRQVYIFEFKLDHTAQSALEQIVEKKYQEKYSKYGKQVVLIGASFSSHTRNISEFKYTHLT